MRISRAPGYIVCLCAFLIMLAGCSTTGSVPSVGSGPNPTQPNAQPTLIRASGIAQNVRPDFRRSWMAPGAKHGRLLYISDSGTDDVDIYTYPKLKLIGTLTGFDLPQGLCLDKAGDVWIVNTNASDLLEYAPRGTNPIATLYDPGEYPVACSGDGVTGDLAASNLISTSNGSSSLSIYKHAAGSPDVIEALTRNFFLSYDPKGNLFVDGENSSYNFALGEIPEGTKKVEQLSVSGATIEFPGSLQYADGNLALSGPNNTQDDTVIYQLAVSGSVATVVGTAQLLGSCGVAIFILGHEVVCVNTGNDIAIYKYPAGGWPIKVIHTSLVEPLGLVITK